MDRGWDGSIPRVVICAFQIAQGVASCIRLCRVKWLDNVPILVVAERNASRFIIALFEATRYVFRIDTTGITRNVVGAVNILFAKGLPKISERVYIVYALECRTLGKASQHGASQV